MLLSLIFPRKCILCGTLLPKGVQDLCEHCQEHTREFTKSKRNIPFVARWTCLWYYKDKVVRSIHRFKFYGARHYAAPYGRFLAKRLEKVCPNGFDLIAWVPTGTFRKLRRGYDQSKLLAEAVAEECNRSAVPVLKKIRNNPPQSRISGASQRKANVLGAYKVPDPALVNGKRILLLDDVITTGATVSECAKTLLLAGAKEVCAMAVASADRE